jgi:lysophospholipase L1-like esterase
MRKLITFGDSWTHGHGVEDDIQYKEQGRPNDFIFTLRMSNGWPRYLADKLDLPFVNFGYPGADNYHICNCIDMFFDHLEKDDLIIIMLSHPYRHIYRPETKYITVKDIILRLQDKLEGFNYFILNSFCQTFYDEPNLKKELVLDRFIQIDVTAADILNDYEKLYDVSVWEYQSRKVYDDKENLHWGDYHPNLLGYKIIADWIYKNLSDSEKNK